MAKMKMPASSDQFAGLKALFINCTLKRSPEKTHTDGLIRISRTIMESQGVKTEEVRAVDHDIATGVYPDMTERGWDNEDGIKHCAMDILYSLQHLGYSIPPQADAGWIGEAGPGPSYGDTQWQGKKIDPPMGYDNDFTNRNTSFMSWNVMHLAKLLKDAGGFPAEGNVRREWVDGTRFDNENPEHR
jgi:hypothetical protein